MLKKTNQTHIVFGQAFKKPFISFNDMEFYCPNNQNTRTYNEFIIVENTQT